MKIKLAVFGIATGSLLFCTPAALAQGGPGERGITAGDPKNANKPYDKHDISGIWSRNGTPGGYGGGGTCRDCGDRGFSNDVPPLTPLGQKMFDVNKPSYGRLLGSADAAAHPEEAIGRRRSVPPVNGSDPYQYCNPMGPSRALIYPDPLEMNVLPDKMLQQFEWGNGTRTIWTDGRPPLMDPDQPRWWGYSTGKWDGDILVVDSSGFNDTGIAKLNETFGWQGGVLSGGSRTVNSDNSVTWTATHAGTTFKGAIGALSIATGTQNTACPIATPMFTLAGGTSTGTYSIPVVATYLHGMLESLTITNATLSNGTTLSVATNSALPPSSAGYITGTIGRGTTQIATFAVDAFGDGTLTLTATGAQYVITDWHVVR